MALMDIESRISTFINQIMPGMIRNVHTTNDRDITLSYIDAKMRYLANKLEEPVDKWNTIKYLDLRWELEDMKFNENGKKLDREFDENGKKLDREFDENGKKLDREFDENGK